MVAVTTPNVPLTGALLAGGQSKRMGRDKSQLLWEGQPLWRRQLAVLEGCGAGRIVISASAPSLYASCGLQVIPDQFPGCGPIGGIVSLMRVIRPAFLLVLAVDMPAMHADFLQTLVRAASEHRKGIIPRRGIRFEPLAAIYTIDCLLVAEEQIEKGEYALHAFATRLVQTGLAVAHSLTPDEQHFFVNLNTPADVQRFTASAEDLPHTSYRTAAGNRDRTPETSAD